MKYALLTAWVLLAGCSGTTGIVEADAADPASADEAAATAALPMRGSFALTSLQGSVTTTEGALWNTTALRRTFNPATATSWVTLDIDAEGNGTIIGQKSCRPEIPLARRGLATDVGSPAGNLLVALTSLFDAVKGLPRA